MICPILPSRAFLPVYSLVFGALVAKLERGLENLTFIANSFSSGAHYARFMFTQGRVTASVTNHDFARSLEVERRQRSK